MKLRQHLLNTILITASLSCTYLVVELVFFRILLPQLSLNLKTHLPDTAGVLVQASKAGFIPHDYIALLGDSYAEGVGDWLLQVNGDRTKPYHSANIIREATGRDVVSFGRSRSISHSEHPSVGLAGHDQILDSGLTTPMSLQPLPQERIALSWFGPSRPRHPCSLARANEYHFPPPQSLSAQRATPPRQKKVSLFFPFGRR
jgi:hypothetical protein